MAFQGDLQSILATLATGGCYPVINESESIVLPYITYTGIFGSVLTIHSIAEKKRRVQIDVFGSSYGEVRSLMDTVELALDGSSLACSQINEVDAFEEIPRSYRGILEYYFWG